MPVRGRVITASVGWWFVAVPVRGRVITASVG